MVDLDLDVVLTREGHLFVDDEDEFAEHQVSLGYPPEVVALAEDAARTVLAAVAEGREPFATVGHAWLRRVASDAWGGSERT
jgi:protein associated with RNAse G/E